MRRLILVGYAVSIQSEVNYYTVTFNANRVTSETNRGTGKLVNQEDLLKK